MQLLDWDGFDIFRVARLSRQRPLQTVTWALMHHFNVVGDLSLPPDKLRGFLRVRAPQQPRNSHAMYLPTCGGLQHVGLGKEVTPTIPTFSDCHPEQELSCPISSHKVLLQALEGGYNKNPYHNATHAADVTQNVGVMLAADDLPSRLSKLEVLAMLLAAAVHDVNHPGGHISAESHVTAA